MTFSQLLCAYSSYHSSSPEKSTADFITYHVRLLLFDRARFVRPVHWRDTIIPTGYCSALVTTISCSLMVHHSLFVIHFSPFRRKIKLNVAYIFSHLSQKKMSGNSTMLAARTIIFGGYFLGPSVRWNGVS